MVSGQSCRIYGPLAARTASAAALGAALRCRGQDAKRWAQAGDDFGSLHGGFSSFLRPICSVWPIWHYSK